jgi:hypothetical protein
MRSTPNELHGGLYRQGRNYPTTEKLASLDHAFRSWVPVTPPRAVDAPVPPPYPIQRLYTLEVHSFLTTRPQNFPRISCLWLYSAPYAVGGILLTHAATTNVASRHFPTCASRSSKPRSASKHGRSMAKQAAARMERSRKIPVLYLEKRGSDISKRLWRKVVVVRMAESMPACHCY